MSYLAIARAAEARLKAERDPEAILADAYRKYWATPEKAPMDTFTAFLVEIGTLEGQLDPGRAIATLEAEAQRFHRETGLCPYCRLKGELHQGEPVGNDGRNEEG